MGQYNPNQPLAVGNEFAPVIYSPYQPDLFVERGWSFKAPPSTVVQQASMFVDSLPAWSVPGHAYLISIYRRGQETNTGPMKTATVPLTFASSTNVALGGGAPGTPQAIANPTDGWYLRLRSSSTGEAYTRLRSNTSIPAFLEFKRIVDVSILYTASAEPGNEEPVPLEINHYYDVDAARVSYGTAEVDQLESFTTDIRRSRWGEINTWSTVHDPFDRQTSRTPWNYNFLTLFETGNDFLVEFRTESAAQDGPREIYLHYATMQITYCEENRVSVWGVVLGADYDLTADTGEAGGYRLGRNSQGPDNASGFVNPLTSSLAAGGASSFRGNTNIQVTDATVTIKRADYGPYNNQGDLPLLRALRTVDRFPGHPGVVINNTIEPGQTNSIEPSDLLPQIVLQNAVSTPSDIDNIGVPYDWGYTYGVQSPIQVSNNIGAVQEIVPTADAPDTEYPKIRFWARHHLATAPLRVEIETSSQGPVTVASIEPAELDALPEIVDGWRRVDLEVEPGLLIDDFSVASGTQPEVQDTVHEASGGPTASWNVTAPAGDLEGRLLLLLHGADTSSIAEMGTPTGGTTWNLLHDAEDFDISGPQGAARLWWKVGGAAEPASYGLTQDVTSDGVAIVTAVQNVDETGLWSAETFNDPSVSLDWVDTPNVPMDGQGGVDLRFAIGLFNNATWTPPDDWTLLAGSVGTPFVSAGLAARTASTSGEIQRMTSSVSNDLGRLGVTVTLSGTVVGPAAPRWESDTSVFRAWEVLGSRVIDPDIEGAINPAAPAETGIGTYGNQVAEGGVEGDLPATADIDIAVVWGQAMPTVEGLAVVEAIQPIEVVDPACPIPPECIADGIRYLQVTWTPIDSGYEFVGLGSYELQRQDDTMDADEWETVAAPAHPLVDVFDDYETRVGVSTHYRIRYVHQNGMVGDWSDTVSAEVQRPGVTGIDGARARVLIFTSNEAPDRNLAYVPVWQGAASEDFDFVEADTQELQRMFGRDFQVAFRPLERGGVAFSRSLLVNAATIPNETLSRGFESLRDLAWSQLSYVAVRDERGDRWLSNISVPSGTIRDRRRLYVAEIRVTEVTDTPSAPEPTVCEGMAARGALPGTAYEPRFATTPAGAHLDSEDLSVRVEMRLDQTDQYFPIVTRFNHIQFDGWWLESLADGTFKFNTNTGGSGGTWISDPRPFGPGDRFWLRLDYDADGAGTGASSQFFTSTDGSTWNPLATAGGGSVLPASFAAAHPLVVGATFDGTSDWVIIEETGGSGGWNGVIPRMQLLDGPAGALLANPDFEMQDPEAVSFEDSQGNTWSVSGGVCTVNRRQ